jgi:hypothetical protein
MGMGKCIAHIAREQANLHAVDVGGLATSRFYKQGLRVATVHIAMELG